MNRETDQESLRRTLWRMVGVILGVGAALYVLSIYSVATDSDHRSQTGNVVGVDYSTFHAGATMLRYRDADQLYDLEAMTGILREVRRGPVGLEPTYLNPPAFAMVLTPFAPLRYEVGLALWTTLGIVAFFFGLRSIGTTRPAFVLGAVLVSVPGFIGVTLGQGQFFWAALYAGVLSRLRAGQATQAGLLAAVLILKPQLLAPIVLWWLIDWRRHHRSLVTVAVAASAISLAPAVLFPGSYSGYLSMLKAASDAFPLNGIPMGVTLRDTVDAFTGGSSVWSGAIVLGGVAVFAIVLVRGVRSEWGTDVMFIVATVGGLLVIPHLVMYDWVVLVPVGIVFAQHIPARSVALPMIIVGLLYTSLFQAAFGIASFEQFGSSIQIAALVLVSSAVFGVRQILQEPTSAHMS